MDGDIGTFRKSKWILFIVPQRVIVFGEQLKVTFLLHRNVDMIELIENKTRDNMSGLFL